MTRILIGAKILVFASLAFLLIALAHSAVAQESSLSQESFTALQQKFDVVSAQMWATKDVQQLDALLAQRQAIGDELTKRDRAAFEADDAAFESLGAQIAAVDVEMQALARKKWCHTSPWRLLRRYRQPAWCAR
ncbi:MAG: hypothetical protein ACYCSP_06005 [Acidobacteriaceae bacterium]